jgi:hypothetical protein
MKMLNKIEASKTPRWDMMMEVKKMQVTLDRMYGELQTYGEADELAGLCGAISNLNHLMLKLDNHRVGEVENA